MPSTALTPAPRAAVLRMKEYHPPLGNRFGLRLDFNENTVACSPAVLRALQQITAADLTRYPERAPAERSVAEHVGVRPEEVLLTNGVDEAIHVVCQTYLDGSGEVLLPVPTYSMYEVYASATGAKIVAVQADRNFQFPLNRLLAAITPNTKLIAVANPNSPTGSIVSRRQILAIAECAPHAALLIDEAYFHFHGETALDLIGSVPNLFVARTFSKAYGLAGLRLGALLTSAQNMQWLRRVISPYSVNSLALACLAPALDDKAYLREYVREVLAARAEFATALNDLHIEHWPSEANFLLVNIGSHHNEFADEMRAQGILVRDRSNDPGCDGCVRITIGTREQMRQAAAAIRQWLARDGEHA